MMKSTVELDGKLERLFNSYLKTLKDIKYLKIFEKEKKKSTKIQYFIFVSPGTSFNV